MLPSFRGVGADLRLGIVASGNEVIVMSPFLIEGSELDETVAHHIRVRCETRPHLIHSVFRDLIPVLLVAVDHFEFTPILMGHSRSHLEILLRRAVPLLFLLRTYLNIETIGMQSESCKLVNHHTTVDSSRQQHRNALTLYLTNIHISLLTLNY